MCVVHVIEVAHQRLKALLHLAFRTRRIFCLVFWDDSCSHATLNADWTRSIDAEHAITLRPGHARIHDHIRNGSFCPSDTTPAPPSPEYVISIARPLPSLPSLSGPHPTEVAGHGMAEPDTSYLPAGVSVMGRLEVSYVGVGLWICCCLREELEVSAVREGGREGRAGVGCGWRRGCVLFGGGVREE